MAAAVATGNTLSLTPKTGAYLYENLPCENTVSDGYSALAFTLSGPPQSSFLVELQTKASCADTAVKRAYQNVTVPATASTVTIPLSAFADSNLSAVTSIVMSTFNKTGSPFTIGSIQLVCK